MKRQFHHSRRARNVLILSFITLALAACGSDKINLSDSKNVQDAVDAATGPLEDLNIRKREIPEPLLTAALNPYARPKVLRCAMVREEIAGLDELLGPDMKPKQAADITDDGFLGVSDIETPTRDQIEDHVGGYAHSAIIGMIARRVNVIPFRSVVRSVTGANRHQSKVTEAYEAGKLRRAYLKGFAAEHFGKKCLDLETPTETQKVVVTAVSDSDQNESPETEAFSMPGSARRR